VLMKRPTFMGELPGYRGSVAGERTWVTVGSVWADAEWIILGIIAPCLAAVPRSTPEAPQGSRGVARGGQGGGVHTGSSGRDRSSTDSRPSSTGKSSRIVVQMVGRSTSKYPWLTELRIS